MHYHIAGQTYTATVMRRLMEIRLAYHNPGASIINALYSWNAVMASFVRLRTTSAGLPEVGLLDMFDSIRYREHQLR